MLELQRLDEVIAKLKRLESQEEQIIETADAATAKTPEAVKRRSRVSDGSGLKAMKNSRPKSDFR